jgi:hypothetical protein
MKAESSAQEKWTVLLPMTHLLPYASSLLIYLMINNENEMSVIQDGNACRTGVTKIPMYKRTITVV